MYYSTESGWDNPFRPDGDLSREADEIVSLIKGGKPITPTIPIVNQSPICDEKEEKVHANNVNVSFYLNIVFKFTIYILTFNILIYLAKKFKITSFVYIINILFHKYPC